ncbi:G patch domain-containing protein 8 [Geodia barretti]|nr:G patch domain-containing protein 8 [Geodia barretti]
MQAEKEDKLVETILEMNKSFYCDLCDKQYFKYSEYDNHLNSYDHHHRQRLKDLKQWEAGRRFGGHREEEEKKKLRAAYEVAMEKAYMRQRQSRRKTAPGFKPISGGSTTFQRPTPEIASGPAQDSADTGVKRPSEDGGKAAEKKSRLSKYGGLKFQSAGNLVTVGDKTRMDEAGKKGRGYQDSMTKEEEGPPETQPRPGKSSVREGSPATRTQSIRTYDRSSREGSAEYEGSKFSFGFSKKKTQSQPAKSDPSEGEPKKSKSEGPKGAAPGPPPLMSRQRELMTKAFGGDSDSDEDEGMELTKMAVRGTPRFMFHIRK